ncbi:hypothetical protein FACS189493_0080 [Spirochaetia bacterium]|nr:hypothetical protein FACS189493_0080 [Spirochaetia bacterium]
MSNAFNIKNIENVYRDKPLLYTFAEKSEIPVIVLNETNWKYAELVPYFNDDQMYIFCSKEDYMINLNKFNDCYFIIETSLVESGNYSIESFKKITEVSYFTCYRE